MIYEMKLIEKEFNNIKYNGKILEVRLNDEKRKKIKVGDEIIFYKKPLQEESILVEVKEIHIFNTFENAYMHFENKDFGYCNLNIEEMLGNIYSIYNINQEKKYGVMVMKFIVVKY